MIDTDGLETLCADPEEATARMRNLIEDLAVRLARQYPDQDELPAGMLANVERIGSEIPPGGMRVPLFHDSTTDTEHASHVLRADSLRWQASSARSLTPIGPTSPTRRSAGRSSGGLALEGFDEASRPS